MKNTLKFILTLVAATMFIGCVHNSVPEKKRDKGYCFKAEGLSKMRCYPTPDQCWHKQSIISDQYPWAKIQYNCQRTVF